MDKDKKWILGIVGVLGLLLACGFMFMNETTDVQTDTDVPEVPAEPDEPEIDEPEVIKVIEVIAVPAIVTVEHTYRLYGVKPVGFVEDYPNDIAIGVEIPGRPGVYPLQIGEYKAYPPYIKEELRPHEVDPLKLYESGYVWRGVEYVHVDTGISLKVFVEVETGRIFCAPENWNE